MSNNKMREALEAVYECAKDGVLTIRESAFEKVVAALAEPLRNCDAFSKAEVLEVLEDRSFSKEDTIEWLFAEAKGANDEQM